MSEGHRQHPCFELNFTRSVSTSSGGATGFRTDSQAFPSLTIQSGFRVRLYKWLDLADVSRGTCDGIGVGRIIRARNPT